MLQKFALLLPGPVLEEIGKKTFEYSKDSSAA